MVSCRFFKISSLLRTSFVAAAAGVDEVKKPRAFTKVDILCLEDALLESEPDNGRIETMRNEKTKSLGGLLRDDREVLSGIGRRMVVGGELFHRLPAILRRRKLDGSRNDRRESERRGKVLPGNGSSGRSVDDKPSKDTEFR